MQEYKRMKFRDHRDFSEETRRKWEENEKKRLAEEFGFKRREGCLECLMIEY